MKGIILEVFIVLSVFCYEASGQKVNITGQILDDSTNSPIPFANIINSPSNGTVADFKGNFSIAVPEGITTITVSHTGYQSVTINFNANKDTSLAINLTRQMIEMEEVQVSGEKNDFVRNPIPGMISISQKDLMSQPSLMGMPDVISTLQKATGVQSVNEGIAGIYVRGGDVGQNLIIYDNIELIDPSHLLGAYSAFNPYLLQSVVLYKGNAPVQYSNRLSSAIIVKSYEKIIDQPAVTVNIGTLASTVAVCHQQNKFGFILGARRTQLEAYKGIITAAFPDSKGFLQENNYNFSDLNGKLFFSNGKYDHLSFSWYLGGDELVYSHTSDLSVGIDWQNKGAAFEWKKVKSTFSLSNVVGLSTYGFDFSSEVKIYDINFNSDYRTLYYKTVFNKKVAKHLFTANANLHYYSITPQQTSFTDDLSDFKDRDKFNGLEASAGLADKWKLSDKLTAYLGLRENIFSQLGDITYYNVINNDTIAESYSKTDLVKSYYSFTPLAYITWQKHENLSFKFAYSYNVQNLHRGSLATLPLPADIWILSSKYLKPENAHNLSIGTFKTYKNYDFSCELYGKKMNHLLLFELNYLGNLKTNFEENFIAGEGFSTGLELMARKNSGKLNGWIAYTLSKTMKRINGVNNNEWFKANYDRVHDLSIVLNYKYNNKIDFSSSFILASGNTTTVPAGRYYMMGYIASEYTNINDFRLPLYHRLDVSANYHLTPKHAKESVLNLSIINIYNRKNTYFFFYEMNGSLEHYDISVRARQFSLFPFLPSVSWILKF